MSGQGSHCLHGRIWSVGRIRFFNGQSDTLDLTLPLTLSLILSLTLVLSFIFHRPAVQRGLLVNPKNMDDMLTHAADIRHTVARSVVG